MKILRDDSHLHSKKRGHKKTNPADTIILDFQPLEL